MIVLYIFLCICSILFYILFKGAFSFYLLGFFLILTITIIIIQNYSKKKLSISFLEISKTACKDEKVPLILKVQNMSSFPIPNCKITIAYTSKLKNDTEYIHVNTPIFPKNTQYLTLHISSKHYGATFLKIKSVKIEDMLKVFKCKVNISKTSLFTTENCVTFIPKTIELDNPVSNYSNMGLETEDYSKNKKGDDPSQIFDLHEYIEGDKINRIHWKLTAKQDTMMVKDYSLPITNSIMIVVDLFLEHSKNSEEMLNAYDALIDTVSAISTHLIGLECPHKIVWFDSYNYELVIETISDYDDYLFAINKILQSKIIDKPSATISSIEVNEDITSKCGNVIYCTTEHNNTIFNALIQTEMSLKYTIMLVDSKNSGFSSYFEDNLAVVPIKIGNVSNSLDEICL